MFALIEKNPIICDFINSTVQVMEKKEQPCKSRNYFAVSFDTSAMFNYVHSENVCGNMLFVIDLHCIVFFRSLPDEYSIEE